MRIQSRMKIAILAGAFTAICGMAPAYAQDGGAAPGQDQSQASPAQQPEATAPQKGMRPNLGLTEDQKAQMKQIRESTKSQVAAVNNDASLTAEQKQAKIREVRHSGRKQMNSVLTAEQRETMKQWRQRRHAHRRHRMPPSSQPPVEQPSPQSAPQQ